ncbi:tail fiber protein [uncultured Flavobacterium sp.]|uniref:tail fiber protein n=1 Tax=uncultured Flavobacterium sp. TaxID=165435 RepID=UPI0025DCB833|nr:tail fiber protein [uncultured Flavobacterium sp.]
MGSSFLSITAQSLNPVSYISASGSADSFNAGYTFAYATSGTPWNGSLISYGGFPINNYDTQISSDYGPGGGKHISFRTKNGDLNIWNPWIELATKGENDFTGKQSISGYLGLGLSEPLNKLHIHGGHGDSRILLHSAGGGADTHQADLMLWASEPGLSYTGVGIGNNIHNFNNPNGGLKLLNTARGGSYIRLLDCAMQFNVVNSVGEDKQVMSINTSGNVGIGTLNPDTKLAVKGTIHSQEVKVDMEGWSDFVFKKEYNLPTLEQVQKHIAEKGHLENIPSEEEVLKNGINLGEMNAKLLQKIEELTLYIIQQEKKSNAQAIQIEALSKENEVFGNLLQRLTTVEEKLKIERNEK